MISPPPRWQRRPTRSYPLRKVVRAVVVEGIRRQGKRAFAGTPSQQTHAALWTVPHSTGRHQRQRRLSGVGLADPRRLSQSRCKRQARPEQRRPPCACGSSPRGCASGSRHAPTLPQASQLPTARATRPSRAKLLDAAHLADCRTLTGRADASWEAELRWTPRMRATAVEDSLLGAALPFAALYAAGESRAVLATHALAATALGLVRIEYFVAEQSRRRNMDARRTKFMRCKQVR